jgi:hypothetical protein
VAHDRPVGTLVHTHEAYQQAFGEISALGERSYRLKVKAHIMPFSLLSM